MTQAAPQEGSAEAMLGGAVRPLPSSFPPSIKVRDYQAEGLQTIKDKFREGVYYQLISMATGLGKGSLLAWIPRIMKIGEGKFAGKKLLFIVHREELLRDIASRFTSNNPGLRVGIEMADEWAPADSDIICASIQTIGSNSNRKKKPKGSSNLFADEEEAPLTQEEWRNDRLMRWSPDDIAAVLIDEAHHTASPIYENVLRYLNLLKSEMDPGNRNRKLLLGVTATPGRADNVGLNNYYDEIVFERNIVWGMKQGYLAPDVKCFQFATEIGLDEVKTRAGELAVGELSKAVNTLSRNRLIVNNYIDKGEGKKGLAFTVDVQHAIDLAAAFVEGGVPAAAVSYRTPKDERKELIQGFRDGKIRILCSSSLLAEGFDDPSAVVAIMARPIKSPVLFAQAVGRVLRPYPSKEEIDRLIKLGEPVPQAKQYAIVLDPLDSTSRHKLASLNSMFGMPRNMRITKPILEQQKEFEEIMATAPGLDPAKAPDIETLKQLAMEIDLLGNPTVPEEIKKNSNLQWAKISDGYYILVLPKSNGAEAAKRPERFVIRETALGLWETGEIRNSVFYKDANAQLSLSDALNVMDARVPDDQRSPLRLDGAWRRKPPSEKSLNLFGKLYPEIRSKFSSSEEFRNYCTIKWTQGEVSSMIGKRAR